jgi:hypothetical protein
LNEFHAPLDSSAIPNLEDIVTTFLQLQFGKTRVFNLSTVTENSDHKECSWNIKVDNIEALLKITKDRDWVIFG